MMTSQSSRPMATGDQGWQSAFEGRRRHPSAGEGIDSFDECLLAEVDFKWLMTGYGWWIDTTRLHCDASYAARYLATALASRSSALRECAAWLVLQCEGLTPRDRPNFEAAKETN